MNGWKRKDQLLREFHLKAEFKLEILNDDIGVAEDEEYISSENPPEDVRIREVVLFGNSCPLFMQEALFQNLTSSKGYPGLGLLGSKPLGDLLFQSELFVKPVENLHNLKCLMAKNCLGKKNALLSSRTIL